MYCNNCGTQNSEGVNFCSNCGGQLLITTVQSEYNASPNQPMQQPYNATYVAPQPEKKKNNKLIGIIAGVAVLVVVAVIAIVLVLSGSKKGLDNNLIGKWENVMTDEIIDDYEFSMYTYMEFKKDGTYEVYLNSEKTVDSIENAINKYFEDNASHYGVTFDEALEKTGYDSVDEFMNDIFNMDELAESINNNGYWEAEDGAFYDLYEQGNRDSAVVLDYSISEDGNTLEFDGLTWTKDGAKANSDSSGNENQPSNENNQNDKNSSTIKSIYGNGVEYTYSDGTQVKYLASAQLTINGKNVTLPCKLSDLLETTGFSLEKYVPSTIGADYDEVVVIENKGNKIWVTVANFSNQEIDIADALVSKIDLDDEIDESVVVIGTGLKMGMTYDEVIEAVGQASYDWYEDDGTMSYDEGENGSVYIVFDLDSKKVEEIEIELYDASFVF